MITSTKRLCHSQEAGPCGAELIKGRRKSCLLGKWGLSREEGPRSGLRWAQDRGLPASPAGARTSLWASASMLPQTSRGQECRGIERREEGEEIWLNNQSDQGQCPDAPPDFSPGLSPMSPVQSYSPHWPPCVCLDRSGRARALGAHVDRIELDWIDWMLRDRIQSKLQLNLPDLNLLIRKG